MKSKNIGETCIFTGGAEPTPTITVKKYNAPGSLNSGEKTLSICQDGKEILLSPSTMEHILNWYKGYDPLPAVKKVK